MTLALFFYKEITMSTRKQRQRIEARREEAKAKKPKRTKKKPKKEE